MLVIQAEYDGIPLQFDVRVGMPGDQRSEFNRYVALAHIANTELGFCLAIVETRLEHVVAELEVLDEMKRILDRSKKLPAPSTRGLQSLHSRASKRLSREAELVADELAALDAAWRSLAGEFETEQLCYEQLRANFDSVRKRTLLILDALGSGARQDLPAPSQEALTTIWAIVKRSLSHLERLENF